MRKKSEGQRATEAARRKVEIAAGVRQDRRFVEKVVPNKRRKKHDKQNMLETHKET